MKFNHNPVGIETKNGCRYQQSYEYVCLCYSVVAYAIRYLTGKTLCRQLNLNWLTNTAGKIMRRGIEARMLGISGNTLLWLSITV
jgi:hypothetical protein